MGDDRYTGSNQDVANYCKLSQSEMKEYALRLFVEQVFNKDMITQYCSSPEFLYNLLNERIGTFDLDYDAKGLTGYWNFRDIYINPNNIYSLDGLDRSIFHEILHAYVTSPDFCGLENSKTHKAIGIDEGITEYISQKHIPNSKYDIYNDEYSFSVGGAYPEQQVLVRQLCAMLGEKVVLSDYFGHTQYTNMYGEVDKYNLHNMANGAEFSDSNIRVSNSSKIHLNKVYNYSDIIYNISGNKELQQKAFMSAQKELFKLMEEQIEYVGQPENYNEIEIVKQHFIDFSKVSPSFSQKAKDERNLDINAMRDSLANTIANAYTRDEDKVDFKTGVISNNLEMDFESMSYQGLSNSDINVVFKNGQIFDMYSQNEAIANQSYTLEEFHMRQNGISMSTYGMEEKAGPKLPNSTYKALQSYLSKAKGFFPYSTINISNGLIVLSEGNKTVCFGYDNTGVLTPQDLESKKSFEGDIDLPTEFEKLPETIEPPKSIFEKIGDRFKSQAEEQTKPVQQQEPTVSEPVIKGTLIDQIRGTAPKPESQLKGDLVDKSHSQVNQQLIDSIRGMSSEDYAKYQAEQEATPVKGKEQGPERGNSINKLNTNPGGMDR